MAGCTAIVYVMRVRVLQLRPIMRALHIAPPGVIFRMTSLSGKSIVAMLVIVLRSSESGWTIWNWAVIFIAGFDVNRGGNLVHSKLTAYRLLKGWQYRNP